MESQLPTMILDEGQLQLTQALNRFTAEDRICNHQSLSLLRDVAKELQHCNKHEEGGSANPRSQVGRLKLQ